MKLTLGEGAEEMYTALEGVKVRGGAALDPVLQGIYSQKVVRVIVDVRLS